jgi:hypothetical protein
LNKSEPLTRLSSRKPLFPGGCTQLQHLISFFSFLRPGDFLDLPSWTHSPLLDDSSHRSDLIVVACRKEIELELYILKWSDFVEEVVSARIWDNFGHLVSF